MNFPEIPGFPVSASKHAVEVDYLFLGLLLVSVGILLILFVVISYSVIHFRAGSKADRSPIFLSPRKLEITWTILPTLIFLGLFAWGASLYLQIDRGEDSSEEIYVVARQWMWEMRYPNGRREHNTLVVPLGRPIRLILTSEDVIHSFYIPAMRIKHDVVPGRYVTMSFTATRAGDYPVRCAEYCGTKHSAMIGRVVVMKPMDYEQWLTAGGPLPSLAEAGQKLFAEKGCAGCHVPGSSVHAPMLWDLYGLNIPLEDGTFIQVDEQYLHDSILQPLKQVAAGYAPVMPSYQGQLKETEVLALVQYIKTLKSPAADTRTRPEAERKIEP